MQSPTCTGLRIRSVRDAEIVLQAVFLRRLPMVTRRLDDEERLFLKSGCVYVWEERSSNPLEATGQEIQRFTEGRSWGPSRARDDFLLYYEKESSNRSSLLLRGNLNGSQLIKQTYSVYVHGAGAPPRKWHLNAYYTQDSVDRLRTVDDFPQLRDIKVPEGHYVCARTSSARRARPAPRASSADDRSGSQTPSPSSEISSCGTPGASPRSLITVGPANDLHGNVAIPSAQYPPDYSPPSSRLSHCQLVPLEFLQNISPKPRDPIDEQVLKSFV